MSNRFRIGTRGSRLALAQAGWVAARLEASAPDVDVEVVEIRTFGDVHQDRPLRADDGTAFFTKEIEDALLEGRIDLAVHSCKDLATRLPEGLVIAAVPEREDARDVLVSRSGTLTELAPGATIGTSSVRRTAFLAHARPDLVTVALRGNVPTRLGAVDDGRVEGVILAAAGLVRLGLAERITEHFGVDAMVPAAGQGALALEAREGDDRATQLAALLDDAGAHAEVVAERACLRRLAAGCQTPVGARAVCSVGELALEAAIVGPAGVTRGRASAPRDEAEALGERVAVEMLDALGLTSLRDASWAGPPPRDSGTGP